MDQLLRYRRSWRWFSVRVAGLLSHDTRTRSLLVGEGNAGASPAEFGDWLKGRAKRE